MSKKKKNIDELLEEALVPEDEQPYEIPKNWVYYKFGSIIDIQGGTQPPKSQFIEEELDGYVRLIQIRDYKSDKYKVFIPKKKNLRIVNEEDITIARYGASVGQIHTGLSGAINVALAKVIYPSNIIYKNFLYWLLKTDYLQIPLKSVSRSAQAGFNKGDLEEIIFPLPPLSEQKRIVDKIEILFAKIDEAQKFIKEAKATFELRRAAIFKEVYGDPNEIASDKWKTIGELFYVQVGSTPSRKIDEYWNGENPWLSSGEVNFNRVMDSKEKVTDLAVKEARLKLAPKGSILFGMIGEGKTRGQVAILEIDSYHNQNMASIWVSETNIPTEYVYYWLVSKYTENRQNSSGNNQPAYNKTRVQALTIPIYEETVMREKVKILSKLEELESKVSKMIDLEQSISNIKKSILSKAFKGELGTNDSTDEPAIELLKSILQEKL